ncbi:hypothetical protein HK405_003895, partial [Cladochytrium tenue]
MAAILHPSGPYGGGGDGEDGGDRNTDRTAACALVDAVARVAAAVPAGRLAVTNASSASAAAKAVLAALARPTMVATASTLTRAPLAVVAAVSTAGTLGQAAAGDATTNHDTARVAHCYSRFMDAVAAAAPHAARAAVALHLDWLCLPPFKTAVKADAATASKSAAAQFDAVGVSLVDCLWRFSHDTGVPDPTTATNTTTSTAKSASTATAAAVLDAMLVRWTTTSPPPGPDNDERTGAAPSRLAPLVLSLCEDAAAGPTTADSFTTVAGVCVTAAAVDRAFLPALRAWTADAVLRAVPLAVAVGLCMAFLVAHRSTAPALNHAPGPAANGPNTTTSHGQWLSAVVAASSRHRDHQVILAAVRALCAHGDRDPPLDFLRACLVGLRANSTYRVLTDSIGVRLRAASSASSSSRHPSAALVRKHPSTASTSPSGAQPSNGGDESPPAKRLRAVTAATTDPSSSSVTTARILADFAANKSFPMLLHTEMLHNDLWYRQTFLPELVAVDSADSRRLLQILRKSGRLPEDFVDSAGAAALATKTASKEPGALQTPPRPTHHEATTSSDQRTLLTAFVAAVEDFSHTRTASSREAQDAFGPVADALAAVTPFLFRDIPNLERLSRACSSPPQPPPAAAPPPPPPQPPPLVLAAVNPLGRCRIYPRLLSPTALTACDALLRAASRPDCSEAAVDLLFTSALVKLPLLALPLFLRLHQLWHLPLPLADAATFLDPGDRAAVLAAHAALVARAAFFFVLHAPASLRVALDPPDDLDLDPDRDWRKRGGVPTNDDNHSESPLPAPPSPVLLPLELALAQRLYLDNPPPHARLVADGIGALARPYLARIVSGALRGSTARAHAPRLESLLTLLNRRAFIRDAVDAALAASSAAAAAAPTTTSSAAWGPPTPSWAPAFPEPPPPSWIFLPDLDDVDADGGSDDGVIVGAAGLSYRAVRETVAVLLAAADPAATSTAAAAYGLVPMDLELRKARCLVAWSLARGTPGNSDGGVDDDQEDERGNDDKSNNDDHRDAASGRSRLGLAGAADGAHAPCGMEVVTRAVLDCIAAQDRPGHGTAAGVSSSSSTCAGDSCLAILALALLTAADSDSSSSISTCGDSGPANPAWLRAMLLTAPPARRTTLLALARALPARWLWLSDFRPSPPVPSATPATHAPPAPRPPDPAAAARREWERWARASVATAAARPDPAAHSFALAVAVLAAEAYPARDDGAGAADSTSERTEMARLVSSIQV